MSFKMTNKLIYYFAHKKTKQPTFTYNTWIVDLPID